MLLETTRPAAFSHDDSVHTVKVMNMNEDNLLLIGFKSSDGHCVLHVYQSGHALSLALP